MSQLKYMVGAGGPTGSATGFDDLAAVLFGDDLTGGEPAGDRDDCPGFVGGGEDGSPLRLAGRRDGRWDGPRAVDESPRAAGGTRPPAAGDGESAEDRRARVERLRHAVRVDAYDNELKLSIAVDRMLDNLATGDAKPDGGGGGRRPRG